MPVVAVLEVLDVTKNPLPHPPRPPVVGGSAVDTEETAAAVSIPVPAQAVDEEHPQHRRRATNWPEYWN